MGDTRTLTPSMTDDIKGTNPKNAPSRPIAPTAPDGSPLDSISRGVNKLMQVLGQQGIGPLYSKAKQTIKMAVGFVPGTYNYDPFGAGLMQSRRIQGETATETNLCYALLENWMRSCSAPQLFFLQTDVIVNHILNKTRIAATEIRKQSAEQLLQNASCTSKDDGWGDVNQRNLPEACVQLVNSISSSHQEQEAVDDIWKEEAMNNMKIVSFLMHETLMKAHSQAQTEEDPPIISLGNLDNSDDPMLQDLMHDAEEMDVELNNISSTSMDSPTTVAATASDAQAFWHVWDGPGAGVDDPDNVVKGRVELERLKKLGGQHIEDDKLLAVLMDHGFDRNGKTLGQHGTNPVAGSPLNPSIPMVPLLPAMASIFGSLGTAVAGVVGVSNTAGKVTGVLDRAMGGNGMRQIVGLVLGIISAFMNMGIARGQRPGFAAPEAYDPHGPYGPDPFPFQTPGAEKCHRFLTSWLAKCER
jgi:hypothetical protein